MVIESSNYPPLCPTFFQNGNNESRELRFIQTPMVGSEEATIQFLKFNNDNT